MNSSSTNTNQRLRLVSDQAASSDIDANTNSAVESNDEQHFTEYHSRQSAKKRKRQSPLQPSAAEVNNPTQVRRGPLIVGSSAMSGGSVNSRGINAANAPIRKSVFCIDNVNPHYSVDDVVNFVSDLHVNVVSCFEVKSRKRYSHDGENPVPRRAFRLCIHSNDCDLLLDASKWPARVAIYDYFFKKKNITNSNERESWQDKAHDKPADVHTHLSTRGFGSAPTQFNRAF